jgi:Helix-turn-helix of DDE superfamily endonuclease
VGTSALKRLRARARTDDTEACFHSRLAGTSTRDVVDPDSPSVLADDRVYHRSLSLTAGVGGNDIPAALPGTADSPEAMLDLWEMIHREAVAHERTWPPILGLYKSVVVTLTYLRRNRAQAEIAEAFEVSQPTISRAVTALTGLVERALRRYAPTADELDDRTQ